MNRLFWLMLCCALLFSACSWWTLPEPVVTTDTTQSPINTPIPEGTPVPTPVGGGMGKLLLIKHVKQDGTQPIYISNIFVYDLTTRQETQITTNTIDIDSYQYTEAAWSPDGTKIVFCVAEKTIQLNNRDYLWNSLMFTANSDGSDIQRISVFPENVGSYEAQDSLIELRPSFVDNDTILFISTRKNVSNFRNENRQPYLMNLNTLEITIPFTTYSNLNTISISPHRTKIAFSAWNNDSEVYIIDVRTQGNIIQLTDNEFADAFPEFSPDGQWIVFISYRTGTWDLYIMKLDGSDEQRVTTNAKVEGLASWSPDGNWLAYVSSLSEVLQVFIQNMETGEIQQITDGDNPVVFSRWSP